MEYIPIYDGAPETFRWAGFGSGAGTNILACAAVRLPSLLLTDRPNAGILTQPYLADVPRIILNGYEYCGSWQKAQGNPDEEAHYLAKSRLFNEIIDERLSDFENKEGRLDLIVLGGYMRFVMDPLLSRYKDRIINVHPADLSIIADGHRRYIGPDAVYDAIASGERYTRSCVIIADHGADHGEILVTGPKVAVDLRSATADSDRDYVRRYSQVHQSLQKEKSDWHAISAAIRLIMGGRISLGREPVFYGEWRQVYEDDVPLGYGGKIIDQNSC